LVDGDRLINLKEEPDFIEQYIQLRNRNCDLLVTNPVNAAETREWLKREDIEIRGIVCGGVLVGVVILFLSRKGEIAFFSGMKRTGIGRKLRAIIEIAARERGLREVWAWVLSDNIIAQRTFLNKGYQNKGNLNKEHKGQIMTGFVFKKILAQVDKK